MTFDDFNLSKTGDGLLPVIIQDATTLKVLMLGYMDRAAFDKTVEEGRVTFFSRSKQRLWTKGETSGNFLTVQKMFIDCDGDTLLIQADPAGPTCHRGTTACFDTPEDEGFIRSLSKLIQGRHAQMPDGSYTTKLFIKGPKAIAKKVGEEATEMVIEAVDGNRDRFIYETSDLFPTFVRSNIDCYDSFQMRLRGRSPSGDTQAAHRNQLRTAGRLRKRSVHPERETEDS